MSCRFVVIECKKCENIEQFHWPFENVLRIYSDFCSKCSSRIKLSKQQKCPYEWRAPTEVIFSDTKIPSDLRNSDDNRIFVLLYMGGDYFRWYNQEESKLTFPSFKLKYPHSVGYSPGIVALEQLELFFNEPGYVW